MLGPSHIVLECNTKVPMLVDLLQPSRVERDVDGVLGLEGKDDGFRGVDEVMVGLQLSRERVSLRSSGLVKTSDRAVDQRE